MGVHYANKSSFYAGSHLQNDYCYGVLRSYKIASYIYDKIWTPTDLKGYEVIL